MRKAGRSEKMYRREEAVAVTTANAKKYSGIKVESVICHPSKRRPARVVEEARLEMCIRETVSRVRIPLVSRKNEPCRISAGFFTENNKAI